MSDLTDLTENSVGRPSRRQVLVGTAWAVPVVMGVGATPAMAASSVVSVGVTTSGNNGKTVTFTFTFTDAKPNDTVQITAFGDGFKVSGQMPSAVTISNNSAVITVHTPTNPSNPKKTYSVTYLVSGVVGSKTTYFSY
ncbi:hypothetical protein [Propioniciclava tarda]|uniref:Uncharacterized protein n=1 Tax=Propioniciclava tarda TaxID=433330 RepID=A0A4Q9KPF6_PROTD|nr:hypothetical protein [Propioniciclava tarda]TBT95739.1 hypothetical protein ET996_04675 [Propioniciclava tarda]SMO44905.1 hypothetical protein SAMN06266982_10310 [Propioniciclava tarda]